MIIFSYILVIVIFALGIGVGVVSIGLLSNFEGMDLAFIYLISIISVVIFWFIVREARRKASSLSAMYRSNTTIIADLSFDLLYPHNKLVFIALIGILNGAVAYICFTRYIITNGLIAFSAFLFFLITVIVSNISFNWGLSLFLIITPILNLTRFAFDYKLGPLPITAETVFIAALLFAYLVRNHPLEEGNLADLPSDNTFISRPLLPISLLLISGVISTVLSGDRSYSLGVLSKGVIEPLILFSLVVGSVKSRRSVELILYSLFLAAMLGAGYGFYKLLDFGGIKALSSLVHTQTAFSSAYTNPNIFSEVLVLLLPLAIALTFSSSRSLLRRAYVLIASLTMLAALSLTYTRGAWLGFAISLLILLLNRRVRIFFLLIAPIIVIIFIVKPELFRTFLSFFNLKLRSSQLTETVSYEERLNVWKSALVMMRFYPWGIGSGMFRYFYPKFMFPYSRRALDAAHSLSLHTGVEMGWLGMISLIWIMIIFLYRSVILYIKSPVMREIGLGMIASLIGFIVFTHTTGAQFIQRAYINSPILFFWVIGGLIINLLREQAPPKLNEKGEFLT